MVTLKYPFKDLARRKGQTLIALFGLATCVASVTFLILMGIGLGLGLEVILFKTSLGIRYVFSAYLVAILSSSLILGMLILMNVSFTTMKQREHDIGVMKAIGLGGQVGSFFVAEGLILSVTGCALGVFTGAIAYVTYTYLLVGWGYTIRFLLPTLLFAGIFATSTLLSFIFLYFPMYRAFSRLRAAEAISGSSSSKTRIFAGMLKPLERLGLNFKLAVRSVVVRGWEPHRMMGCLAISMMLVTTIALGGQTIQYTTSRYVERGIGENLILISHPEVGTRYIDLLSPVPRVEMTTFDFTAQAYQIDKTFIRWLESEPTVDLVDPRIVTTSRIFEVQYVKPIPGPAYQTTGDDRSANVLVLGVRLRGSATTS